VKNYKNLCDGRIFHFRVHDIPAFVPEKYMTSDVDNLLSINFEISDIKSYARNYEMTPTYGNLHQKLLANQYFGGELDHIDFLKKYTQEVIQNTNNYLERLKKIHSFIANKILWNDEMDYFPSKTLKETFNDESGNCADINLLLVAMLRQAGIVSYPVILSTRSNGKLNPIFCQLEKFNYLVAAAIVDGKTYLVDATEPTRPFNVLPFECLNDEGRAIDYTYNGWIKLRNDEKYSTNSLMTLKLKENGIIEGKVKNIYNGYDAYRLRELITTYTLDGYKAIVASNHPTWQIDSLEVSNVDSIDKQVIEVMNITVKDAYQILETNENSKKYVLTKVLFFSNQLENDFINVERKYPISFGCPIEEKYFFILEVPDNYELIDKKNDIKYMMPQNYGSYTYNLIQNGNFVQLKIKYELQKYDYNNSDYELIRKFQDQVVKKTNEVLLFDVK